MNGECPLGEGCVFYDSNASRKINYLGEEKSCFTCYSLNSVLASAREGRLVDILGKASGDMKEEVFG